MTTTVRITINKHSDAHVCARLLYLDGTEGHKHQCVPGNEEESCNFTIHDDLFLVVHEGVELQGAPNAHIAELERLLADAEKRANLETLLAEQCQQQLKRIEELEGIVALAEQMSKVATATTAEQLATAQARITELESSNADAQKRAAAQRGKTK